MANIDPIDDRSDEPSEELVGGAAAAAAAGQSGISTAGAIGGSAAAAVAGQVAASGLVDDEADRDALGKDTADSGDSFAGEGNPHPEPFSEGRGISSDIVQNQ